MQQNGNDASLHHDNNHKERLQLGWATLQIDILRQCIAISEALPGIYIKGN